MSGKRDLRIGSPRAAVLAHHGPAHRVNAAADAGVDHACSDLGGKQIDRIKTSRTEAMNLLASHCLRSEEHTPELQSLMRISYAVFCWTKQFKLKHYAC